MLKEGRRSLPDLRKVIAKDPQKAFRFFELAANQNHPEAQVELGKFYRDGNLVEQDDAEAYKWFYLAAKQSYLWGISSRDDLILKITKAQIAEGERRATAFLAANSSPAKITSTMPIKEGELVVKALGVGQARSFALINNQTFAPGDELPVKVGSRQAKVCCVEIREDSVVLEVEGLGRKELRLH